MPRPPPLVLALILACTGIEAALIGADWRLWGTPLWRPLAYQQGALWAGLWHGWQPNYAAQPATMLVTYAFLHAGPGHLLGNMLALAWLGGAAAERLGPGRRGALRLGLVYGAATLGGGVAFGLLPDSPAPVVGASGAIFGLAGALVVLQARAARAAGSGRLRTGLRAVALFLGLAVFNALMWLAEGGHLAWQVHLGGLAAGGLAAAIAGPAAPPPDRTPDCTPDRTPGSRIGPAGPGGGVGGGRAEGGRGW